MTTQYHKQAISWMLHSLKIILGDESIRRYIIIKTCPTISNKAKKYIRTFDAFVPKGKTREYKAKKIIQYCQEIIKRPEIVVFTATNIQQNPMDNETHFQTFIVDNKEKKLHVIDPAFDKTRPGQQGIYMAEVANDVVIPFFKNNGYSTGFIQLSNPAQIGDDDVYCQSWSLFILLEKIKTNEFRSDISFQIPKTQIEKYAMLLSFYKQIITTLPELGDNLRLEFREELLSSRGPHAPSSVQKKSILNYDPVDLLVKMTKHEM